MNVERLKKLLKAVLLFEFENLDPSDSDSPEAWACQKFNITPEELKEVLNDRKTG